MIKNVSSKTKQFLVAFFVCAMPAASAELLATAAGAAFSSGASGYVKDVVEAARNQVVTTQKTFDNEYNEAVCSFELDIMRQCIENSFTELDEQARQSHDVLKEQAQIDFGTAVFEALAKSALHMALRHELAILSLDFIRACKKNITDKITFLESSLSKPFSIRVLGGEQAKNLEKNRDARVAKAIMILGIWKNNLLAALHEKYPYDCEGGWKDRYTRSVTRHRKRAKEWGLIANLFGSVSIPKIDLQSSNTFDGTDADVEARIVSEIEPLYRFVFDFIRTPLDQQIGRDGSSYLPQMRVRFSEYFPAGRLTELNYDEPQILKAYRKFIIPEPQDDPGE